MQDHRVAVVQMDCRPGDRPANLEMIATHAEHARREGAELAVFPELATTGSFPPARMADLAEPVPGPSTDFLGDLSTRLGLHLVVGMAEQDGDDLYNSAVLVCPTDGLTAHYRKVHLFSDERQTYRAGDEPVVVDLPFARVGLTICYDLMFPEFVRRLVLDGAELILNSTHWLTNDEQIQRWAWGPEQVIALARTRALENTRFVAMACRAGREGGFTSIGHSCVASPTGRLLAAMDDQDGIALADLSDRDMADWRSLASYLDDRRPEVYG